MKPIANKLQDVLVKRLQLYQTQPNAKQSINRCFGEAKETLLHVCARFRFIPTLIQALTLGADPSIPNKEGYVAYNYRSIQEALRSKNTLKSLSVLQILKTGAIADDINSFFTNPDTVSDLKGLMLRVNSNKKKLLRLSDGNRVVHVSKEVSYNYQAVLITLIYPFILINYNDFRLNPVSFIKKNEESLKETPGKQPIRTQLIELGKEGRTDKLASIQSVEDVFQQSFCIGAYVSYNKIHPWIIQQVPRLKENGFDTIFHIDLPSDQTFQERLDRYLNNKNDPLENFPDIQLAFSDRAFKNKGIELLDTARRHDIRLVGVCSDTMALHRFTRGASAPWELSLEIDAQIPKSQNEKWVAIVVRSQLHNIYTRGKYAIPGLPSMRSATAITADNLRDLFQI